MKTGDSTQKTVLITGATDGLGKALVCCWRSAATVFLRQDVPRKNSRNWMPRLREKKVPLESVALDVCSDDSVKRGVEHVLARAGAIDVLVNNAGVNYTAAVEDLSMEAWRAQFETNFFGVLRVTPRVRPQIAASADSGRILMMSSISGLVTAPTQGAYSSSKHALEALSKTALRMELYPFSIPVVLTSQATSSPTA